MDVLVGRSSGNAAEVDLFHQKGIGRSEDRTDIIEASDIIKDKYQGLINELKKEYHCLAVEQTENAVMLQHFVPAPEIKHVLVFGNEVKGVAQDVVNACHGTLEIPQFGTKHSLNIAVSAGVVVWDFWTKMQKEKGKKKP